MIRRNITIVTTSNLAYDHRMQRCINAFLESEYNITCYSRNFNKNDNYTPTQITNQFFKQIKISTLFKSSWLFYAEYNLRIFFKLLFTQQDLIYSVDSDTLLASTVVKLIKNKKLIYDAHEYFEQSPEIINKPLIQKVWNHITRFGVKYSDLNITVGESIRIVLNERYNTNFEVIRNLPETIEFERIDYYQRKKIIWYQGVLNIGRGLEIMIESMKYLPDYELHLAGDGDISKKLVKIVKKYGLESKVIFLGKLNNHELQKKNRYAFIGINLLSSDNLNYYHSLANRTFDYIHSELPSIHMSFPEYSNLIKKHEVGLLISELNTSNIINTIRKFENIEFYNHCIDECKNAKKNNSWLTESEKLKLLIRNLF